MTASPDALGSTVEQLCCDYATADAHELLATGREWLSSVTELLGSHPTLPRHRDVVSNAGMLALLVGCLEYDLGDAKSAEATRKIALALGAESGDLEVVGWAHEMFAWFQLTSGNLRAVVSAAETGIQAAGARSVSVQLHGQQAKAYARMEMPDKAHEALEKGRALLGDLPYPDRPEAQLTLAVVAAREGDSDEASALGMAALQEGRQSRPSLLMVASELEHELTTRGSGADFRDLVADIKINGGRRPPISSVVTSTDRSLSTTRANDQPRG